MLCHRNCGLEATYTNYKGQPCCAKSASKCPTVKGKIGKKNSEKLKGRKATPAQLKGLAKGRNGRKPSADTIKKISESNKLTKSKQKIVPWNKGLTLDDSRVKAYADKQRGQQRAERIKIIPSDDPIYNDFKKYRNRIAVRTKKVYEQNKLELNPNNLPLGKAGISGAHHIDHIMSVKEGFKYNVPIELMSAKKNLRVIPWIENNSKYSNTNYNLISEDIAMYLKETLVELTS